MSVRYSKTPMGSMHEGREIATGRRRLEIEWDDPSMSEVDEVELRTVIEAHVTAGGGTNIEMHGYDQRGKWVERPGGRSKR